MSSTAWLDARLDDAGLRRTGPVETLRERPWATVRSAPTTGGTVWLKECAPATAFEAGLYGLLERVMPERILPQYAELQRAVAPHVGELLRFGLADMRPGAMPARYAEAREKIDAAAPVPDQRFAGWCDELAAAPGDPTVDHNDLHGANMLPAPDGTVRFYDWGDAVVAHPFASMLMGLGVIRHIHGCADDDPRIIRLRDAYLEAFSDLARHAELVRTLELACRVAKVARALVWHRAVAAFPDADPEWTLAPGESLTALADDSYLTGA